MYWIYIIKDNKNGKITQNESFEKFKTKELAVKFAESKLIIAETYNTHKYEKIVKLLTKYAHLFKSHPNFDNNFFEVKRKADNIITQIINYMIKIKDCIVPSFHKNLKLIVESFKYYDPKLLNIFESIIRGLIFDYKIKWNINHTTCVSDNYTANIEYLEYC